MNLLSRSVSLCLIALALTAVSFVGCGVTAGTPIEVSFFANLYSGPTFTTAAGWEVTLTEARLVIGPLYVLAPTARTAMRELLLPTAFAHGGHDDLAALDVRAEWLDETVIEAVGEAVPIGVGHGIAGTAEYTTVDLVMPADTSGPTHGHVAWVVGTATPIAGGETIAFEGGLDLPDEPLARSVESIASPFEMPRSGRFTLMVLAARSATGPTGPSWFEEAHFDRLPVPSTGIVRTIAPGTQPYVAWMLAARDSASFRTSFEPAPGML